MSTNNVLKTLCLAFGLILSLALFGCPTSESGSGGSGGSGSDGSSTTTDGGRRGEDTGGRDITRGGCSGNDDCEATEYCEPTLETCVPRCVDDTGCARSEWCDTDTGMCEPRQPCAMHDECGEGEKCDLCIGVCVLEVGPYCLEDMNCPDFEQYCDTCSQQCVPRLDFCAVCTEDYQCGDLNDRCLTHDNGGRFCGTFCGTGFPCPRGATCSEDHGQCIPLSGDCEEETTCTSDSECSGIQICSPHSICTDGCLNDDACPDPLVCSAGRCEEPCLSEDDCEGDQECRDGHCWVPGGCVTSVDCPEQETYCDRTLGICVEGCEVDGDCLTYELMCEEGSCVHRPCRGAYACAFGQICNGDTGYCEDSPDPHCAECDGNDQNSCGSGNLCASFQDEDGNDLGAFCLLACSSDPLNPCPNGWECEEVETQDGIMNLCYRACYDDPIGSGD